MRVAELRHERLCDLRFDRVALDTRRDFFHGLERLRFFVRSGNALNFRSNVHGRFERRTGALIHCEREQRARRDAGTQLVADQSRKFQQRTSLGRGAQIRFISDALLIKRQHVGHRRGRVEQRDGEIIIVTRLEILQRGPRDVRESREHALLELTVRADAVGNRCESGTVRHGGGRLRSQAFAAMTSVQLAVHFPPPTVSTKTPRSAKFESLSQRAISSRPIGRNPSCSGLRSSCPWRWKTVICTDATPSTACAAAMSGLSQTVWPKVNL